MRIDILTIFPEMFEGPFDYSIIKRAREREKVSIHLHDIRAYSNDKHRRVDDYAYGGGAGMKEANRLSTLNNIIILCGRYKGIDERLREHYITKELSIGNYVLSGGELAAAVISDSIIRLLPGVLNDETSALSDSFQSSLVSAPVYTRPYDYKGLKVPDILLSGNDKMIDEWRLEKAIERTKQRRPDLLPGEDNFYK